MRIDLHTHSDRSDGTLSPAGVVVAAKAAGLDVVALTDHDTAEGWDEATDAAYDAGIWLVPGMEISCSHAGRALHLLAYLADPTYPPLRAELDQVLRGRKERTPRMCTRLRELGIPIREEDVAAQAVGAVAVGRPHVADTLVAMGVVGDRGEAFERYLSVGRPGFIARYAPPVEVVLPLVVEAGGVAVVAHPWGRHDTTDLQHDGLVELRELGLAGLEVDHQDHPAHDRARLRDLAAQLDLVVTGSSDFHGAGKVDHDLGCNTTDPEQFERLCDLAGAASHRSGRRTPELVRP